MTSLRVIVADDHGIVRQGVRALLEAEFDVVAEAADGTEALEAVARHDPDVVVLDLMMPAMGGLEVARRLRDRHARARVVILSMYSDVGYVSEALRCGALGYVLKDASADALATAIREATDGRCYVSPPLCLEAIDRYRLRASGAGADAYELLTKRERDVLRLAAEGQRARDIAERLGISPRTAEAHRARVMHKLGLRSQTDLVRYAVARGLVAVPLPIPVGGAPERS